MLGVPNDSKPEIPSMLQEWIFEESGWSALVLRQGSPAGLVDGERELPVAEARARLVAWQRANRGQARTRYQRVLQSALGRPLGQAGADLDNLVRVLSLVIERGRLVALERRRSTPQPTGLATKPTPPPEPEPPPPPKKTWVEFVLLDEEGVPVPEEKYSVELPDGSTKEGSLDADGKVRIEDIEDGTCWVTFPEIKVRKRPGEASLA
jgi:hypothetical protein